jgi:hypothetical protein
MPVEHPILFQDRLVRAILAGRKTQTRRVVNPQPIGLSNCTYQGHALPGVRGLWSPCDATTTRVRCPYGEPGDLLYVREAWAPMCRARDGPGPCCTDPDEQRRNHYIEFRADTGNPRPGNWPAEPDPEAPVWKPSIHLPRKDSRILLEVQDVRLERLLAITSEDAIAEGLEPTGRDTTAWRGALTGNAETSYLDPRLAFASLWDSINGARPGASWAEKPWVWVVTFRRVQP